MQQPLPETPVETDQPRSDPGFGRLGRLLLAGAGISMLAAGLILWNARGATVFTDVLAAAIAWCF